MSIAKRPLPSQAKSDRPLTDSDRLPHSDAYLRHGYHARRIATGGWEVDGWYNYSLAPCKRTRHASVKAANEWAEEYPNPSDIPSVRYKCPTIAEAPRSALVAPRPTRWHRFVDWVRATHRALRAGREERRAQ
jgi:hypothetical protein